MAALQSLECWAGHDPVSGSVVQVANIPLHHFWVKGWSPSTEGCRLAINSMLNALGKSLSGDQAYQLLKSFKLKVNPDKTPLLELNNSGANISLCFLLSILVSKLTQLNLLGMLGVTFCSYIFAVCQSCFYRVHDLWHICRYLDLYNAKWLANILESSCLAYCNSLLSGIAVTDLTKLQCVQNQLAYVMTMSPPFTRSVPLIGKQ